MRSLYIDSTLKITFNPCSANIKSTAPTAAANAAQVAKHQVQPGLQTKVHAVLAAAGLGVCLLISGVRPSGVLQPVQKVLVLVIAGLHVHSGAGFVLGADVVTQAGTCQRGIIMPAGGPVGSPVG